MEKTGWMKTKYWNVQGMVLPGASGKARPGDDAAVRAAIGEAASFLREGEVVAFPTETVYGLGGNALSAAAVEKIFRAKGRPSDNPLIVHIAHERQLNELVASVPETAERLLRHFWPGPLTLVLPKRPIVPEAVTAGLDTVAVRMPDHPVARALIEAAQLPLAAPSANLSGRPSPTSARHVLEDLEGRIAGVLDGGETGVGVESTVLDVTGEIPLLLRPGGVSLEELQAVIGPVETDPGLLGEKETPRSPGMKYAHYAPRGEMWLVEGEGERMRETIRRRAKEGRAAGRKVGILTTAEHVGDYDGDLVLSCGKAGDLRSVAQNLYRVLREFDQAKIDYILAESFPRTGLGAAIMNRLEKAAGGRIIRV
ncbi:L-threonylcarbamoyladenylate synthase [Bacillaceae bacterium]